MFLTELLGAINYMNRRRIFLHERRSTRRSYLRAAAWFASLCVWAICFAAQAATAVENPFGLPAPQDVKRPGVVMLHGGGHGLREEVREEFVRLAGGRDARIVIMPSDSCQFGKDEEGEPLAGRETAAAYEKRLAEPRNYGRWIALRESKQVADVRFLYRDLQRDPDGSKFFALLNQATGVWMPAHDQAWLPQDFAGKYPQTTSRFQLALRELVARGGVVGGLGGGAACLPETVIESNHIDDSDPGDGTRRCCRCCA